MLGNLAAFAALLGVCALLAWELWLGLAKGYVHTPYTGRAERARRPISFWSYLLFYAVALAVLGYLFVFATISWVTHQTPH
jgi:hypothetical protein